VASFARSEPALRRVEDVKESSGRFWPRSGGMTLARPFKAGKATARGFPVASATAEYGSEVKWIIRTEHRVNSGINVASLRLTALVHIQIVSGDHLPAIRASDFS
jgi:hypothetical protein